MTIVCVCCFYEKKSGSSYSRAALDVEASNRVAVVHGVECCDFVDSHWWHFEAARDFVHDADAGETVLSLSEIEQWHDRRLLVLRRVSSQDLLDELLILCVELEGNVQVVGRRVAVLYPYCQKDCSIYTDLL